MVEFHNDQKIVAKWLEGLEIRLGRVENQKSWKITKPQVDPIDAHKNKTICIILRGFVSITPLENAKIGSTWPFKGKKNFVPLMGFMVLFSTGSDSRFQRINRFS